MVMGLRPALAAMVLAVLAAGCDTVPQTAPAAQPAQSAPPAAAAATTTASGDDSDDADCESDATTGSMIHKKCLTAEQRQENQQNAQSALAGVKATH